MNPNKALWEKGDFTRIAASMRESGDALVADVGNHPRAQGSGSRVRRRDDGGAGGEARGGRAGRRHRREPGRGGQRAGAEPRPHQHQFQEGDASDLNELEDDSFDLVVSIFGAMFAPKPFDVAKEMVRVTRPGGRIVMGNWIPNDPTLVAQILKISSAYSPPPPEGFVSPMTWGVEENVIERFTGAGVPAEKISCERTRGSSTLPGPRRSSSPRSGTTTGRP